MLRTNALLPALLLVAALPALAQPAGAGLPAGVARVTSVEGVTEYRLANGLKILLIPDRSIDTVTVNVTYLVGSRQEGYGETGMAHLLEHLMFRGTPRFPGIKADFQKRGARYNGSTSFDRTNYVETFPADGKTLDYVLDVEADRMATASIARRDLDAEMTVVRNEFEAGENSAFGVLRERMASSAYLWHNYGKAIIGARSDIENVPIERLRAFYSHYYQPDNAVLLLSGKLEESTALRLAQKHFGKILKPSRTLRTTYTVEPTQDGERAVTLRRAGDVQLVSALYHMPPGTHPEYAAVDVLVALLNHVPSGRLHKALVQAAATRYLKPANRTLGTFIPTPSPDRAEIPPVPDLAAALKDYRGSATVALGEDFNPTPANIEARVIRRTLPGGMKLALLPKKTRGGTVVAQLTLEWGDEQSKLNRAAACGVASGMLVRGTRKHSREQLRNQFDRLKANVGVGGDGGSVETVRENLPETLKLMAEVLRQPSFPNEEFEQLRRSSLTGIDTQRSDPGALAGLALSRHLNPYPPEHWLYTTTLDERSARLQALSLAEVKRCYADFYGASDSELAVVGDFDPEEIARLAQELFGDWKSPRPYARIPLRIADVPPADDVINTPDKANAVLRAGVLLKLRDDNPDYPALLLANYVLGGSSDSRLMRRIREKEGLSYSVGSFLSADSFFERGSFGDFAIYAPQNRARVEAAVAEELRKALAEGFSGGEAGAGKKALLQARQLARSSDRTVAGRLASYLVLGRTFAWEEEQERRIAAMTPKAVAEALRRYVDPARLSVVKAGDFATVAANPPGPDRAN